MEDINIFDEEIGEFLKDKTDLDLDELVDEILDELKNTK